MGGNWLRWVVNVLPRQWTRVQVPRKNLPSVLSFKPAKYVCLTIRCKLLDSVHNAQSATVHWGNRQNVMCFLEPSVELSRYWVHKAHARHPDLATSPG
eukprot:15347629-Ditylum_brightwellii.AAC.1